MRKREGKTGIEGDKKRPRFIEEKFQPSAFRPRCNIEEARGRERAKMERGKEEREHFFKEKRFSLIESRFLSLSLKIPKRLI